MNKKEAITKVEVVKAMKTIHEWCLSRDALEDCHDGCPMSCNCQWARVPEQWMVSQFRAIGDNVMRMEDVFE